MVAREAVRDGDAAPRIMVLVPRPDLGWREHLEIAAVLPATAADREVQFAAGLDDEAGRGPWIDGVEFPEDMQRYQPARNTQRIATTNGAPSIDVVPRTATEPRYQVPGGLVGVHGWRSDLYKSGPAPQTWQERLPVKNSFGFIQYELGWTRRYAAGAKFMDVLSYRGRVFEVRVREKGPRGWHSFVDYRNPADAPLGYERVRTSQCASCHRDAGSGGYAVGLAPGGDEVLSDPFPRVR
jgi:hypothetical protein